MTAILAWFNPTRWLLLAGVLAALVLGYLAWADHQQGIGAAAERSHWQAAVAQQKAEAARTLAAETTRAQQAERALNAARAAQEIKDAQDAQTVAQLRADLRSRSRAAGGPGLRDPFAAPRCGLGGGGAASSVATGADHRAADRADAGGLLSVPMEELLLETLDRADAINLAYRSCRADAIEARRPRP